VSLLDLYFSKLPPAAKDKDDFYCRPLENYKQGEYWYIAQPRGKYYLNNMVKNICQEANLDRWSFY